MKCSNKAIKRFREICNNEQDTPDDIVRYKLTRDMILGRYLHHRSPICFVVAFGTLRIKVSNNCIVDVWRGKKCYPVNQYAKHCWDFEHGYEKEKTA